MLIQVWDQPLPEVSDDCLRPVVVQMIGEPILGVLACMADIDRAALIKPELI